MPSYSWRLLIKPTDKHNKAILMNVTTWNPGLGKSIRVLRWPRHPMSSHVSGFLNLGTINIWGQVPLCWGGLSLSSITGLYLLGASSNVPLCSENQKYLQTLSGVLWRAKSLQLRTIAIYFDCAISRKSCFTWRVSSLDPPKTTFN